MPHAHNSWEKATAAARLAQYAMTGCRGNIAIIDEDFPSEVAIELCKQCSATDVAKVAYLSSERGIEDAGVILYAYLSSIGHHNPSLFNKVMRTGKDLHTYVSIIRSGALERRSLANHSRRLIADWFNSRTIEEIVCQCVDTNLADVINSAHPIPLDNKKKALYRWILGMSVKDEELPEVLQELKAWQKGIRNEVPLLPCDLLIHRGTSIGDWCNLVLHADWNWLWSNFDELNDMSLFTISEIYKYVLSQLTDKDLLKSAKVGPYEMLQARTNLRKQEKAEEAFEQMITNALENLPFPGGNGCMAVRVKGTTYDPDKSDAKRQRNAPYLQIADLLARYISYRPIVNDDLKRTDLRNMDWVIFVIGDKKKASPVRDVQKLDLVQDWDNHPSRNSQARLVCLDLCRAYTSTSIPDRDDILYVGGFSDSFFGIFNAFIGGEMTPAYWQGIVDQVNLADAGVVKPV